MKNQNQKMLPLMVGSLGVVYGDIGTSPLYALESCFKLSELSVTPENVIGIVSIFIWLLIIIVLLKYISLIMKCDQQGEGGILVLSAIVKKDSNQHIQKIAVILGLIGFSLFVGDSVITPAISVLSAVEGMQLIMKIPQPLIMFIAIVILTMVFILQREGSGKIGHYFGYIMLGWFMVIAMLGINSIFLSPIILKAINPYFAIKFLMSHNFLAIIIIGSAILVISGVEALYADMGHFGKEAISLSWMLLVFPSLCLNYLGQGALLIHSPAALDNVFYLMTPAKWMNYMIVLSIIATIIASQAVISGIFSLSKQAIMLNYLPRMKILYTSIEQQGQVYVPAMNYVLYIATISAVLFFKNAANLSFAYGLSVAGVMMISTILTCILARYKWHWSILKMGLIFIPLFFLDIIFVSSNLTKIHDGAWYTLLIAAVAMYVIRTWIKGNHYLNAQKRITNIDLTTYLKRHLEKYPTRIPGCAVFLTRDIKSVPKTLEIHLKHNKFLHQKIIFISIITKDYVKVRFDKKFKLEEKLDKIYTIEASFGFFETPDITKITSWVKSKDILDNNEQISIFLSRGIAVIDNRKYLDPLAEKVYLFLTKNAQPVHSFLKIDFKNVLELGVIYKI